MTNLPNPAIQRTRRVMLARPTRSGQRASPSTRSSLTSLLQDRKEIKKLHLDVYISEIYEVIVQEYRSEIRIENKCVV